MSERNIDRLRAGLDAFNRTGELDVRFLAPDFEAVMDAYADDVVLRFHGGSAP